MVLNAYLLYFFVRINCPGQNIPSYHKDMANKYVDEISDFDSTIHLHIHVGFYVSCTG